MSNNPSKKRLVRWRWVVMFIMGLTIAFLEIQAHYHPGLGLFNDSELIRELLMFGFAIPLLGGLLLSILERTELERDQAVGELGQKQAFDKMIQKSESWDDLVQNIVSFPRNVLPAERTFLSIYDHDLESYQLAASWGEKEMPDCDLTPRIDPNELCACTAMSSSTSTLIPCQAAWSFEKPIQSTRYCLPLIYGGLHVGILHLDLPEDQPLQNGQIRTMAGLASEIALAIEKARLQESAASTDETKKVERKRIARYLHDTLGQNISYLRIKLDHLSSDVSLVKIAEIQNELEKMRDIANEAYDQVRNTIAELRPANQADLAESLQSLTKSIEEHSDVVLRLEMVGEAVPLSPFVQRQVIYICREALNNVEKHAKARQVHVLLNWEEGMMILKVKDDGTGFHPEEATFGEKFGITIMSERAESINGTLSLTSSENAGTEVSLQLPLPTSSIASKTKSSLIEIP